MKTIGNYAGGSKQQVPGSTECVALQFHSGSFVADYQDWSRSCDILWPHHCQEEAFSLLTAYQVSSTMIRSIKCPGFLISEPRELRRETSRSSLLRNTEALVLEWTGYQTAQSRIWLIFEQTSLILLQDCPSETFSVFSQGWTGTPNLANHKSHPNKKDAGYWEQA